MRAILERRPIFLNCRFDDGSTLFYRILVKIFSSQTNSPQQAAYQIFLSFLFSHPQLNPSLTSRAHDTPLRLAMTHHNDTIINGLLKFSSVRQHLCDYNAMRKSTIDQAYIDDQRRGYYTQLKLVLSCYFIEAILQGKFYGNVFENAANNRLYLDCIDQGLEGCLTHIFEAAVDIDRYRTFVMLCKYILCQDDVDIDFLMGTELRGVACISTLYTNFKKSEHLSRSCYLSSMLMLASSIIEAYTYNTLYSIAERQKFVDDIKRLPLFDRNINADGATILQQIEFKINLLQHFALEMPIRVFDLGIVDQLAAAEHLFLTVRSNSQVNRPPMLLRLQQYVMSQITTHCANDETFLHSKLEVLAKMESSQLLAWQPGSWCNCFCLPRRNPMQRQLAELKEQLTVRVIPVSAV